MLGISISKKRNPKPVTHFIIDSISLTSWGAIKVYTSHFFPSGFQIKAGEMVVYIDPVEMGSNEKADFILITHAHPDHFSKKTIRKLLKDTTKIICAQGVAKKLKNKGYHVSAITPGSSMQVENVKIEALPAYNKKRVFLWIKAHPKEKMNVGFIITIDGINIYHAGDTDFLPETGSLKNVHTLLVPIGGDNLTMDEKEAAQLTNQLHPQKVVPMHYELKKKKELDIFRYWLDKSIEVLQFT